MIVNVFKLLHRYDQEETKSLIKMLQSGLTPPPSRDKDMVKAYAETLRQRIKQVGLEDLPMPRYWYRNLEENFSPNHGYEIFGCVRDGKFVIIEFYGTDAFGGDGVGLDDNGRREFDDAWSSDLVDDDEAPIAWVSYVRTSWRRRKQGRGAGDA